MLQLDLQQILSQAISFVLLVLILKRVAWKPLLAMLDQRRAHIEEELRQVAQSKAQLTQLQADYAERLAKIDAEARTKIQQAILEGKRIAIEVQEEARGQARAILMKSKETVEIELAKAKVSLRNDVAALTLDAVERILQQKLDPKADRQLVDSVLDDLEGKAARL